MIWTCASYQIDLSVPKVMAVINITADSFSDGGEYLDPLHAYRAIDEAVLAGAHILDIGAESSRPGAVSISETDEWSRLHPVLSYATKVGLPVSVDTTKTAIMRQALDCGAAIINDIHALQSDQAIEVVLPYSAGLCLMHMQGKPQTMQHAPQYVDVVSEVSDFLGVRIQACLAQGIHSSQIVIDPGIGFGKTLEHNLELLRSLSDLTVLGYPLLVGLSRKSFIGVLTEQPNPKDRLAGSLAAALLAIQQGASILRVHDVRATRDALTVWHSLLLNKKR
jgi:dihydropteroate synthase